MSNTYTAYTYGYVYIRIYTAYIALAPLPHWVKHTVYDSTHTYIYVCIRIYTGVYRAMYTVSDIPTSNCLVSLFFMWLALIAWGSWGEYVHIRCCRVLPCSTRCDQWCCSACVHLVAASGLAFTRYCGSALTAYKLRYIRPLHVNCTIQVDCLQLTHFGSAVATLGDIALGLSTKLVPVVKVLPPFTTACSGLFVHSGYPVHCILLCTPQRPPGGKSSRTCL
jgi:hypothetical protein